VAAVLLLLVIGGLSGLFCVRRKRKAKRDAEVAAKVLSTDFKETDSYNQQKSPVTENTFEADGEAKAKEMYSERERGELLTEEHHQELETNRPRQEMYAGEHRSELMGTEINLRHASDVREYMAELPELPYRREQ
jgi:hypothetical protein